MIHSVKVIYNEVITSAQCLDIRATLFLYLPNTNPLISDISQFPSDCYSNGTTFNKQTLFIGGAESEYIPVTDHSEILDIFPRYVLNNYL